MNPKIFQSYTKKIPLILLIYFLGGAICRWIQLKNELLFDGSLAEGAIMHRVLPILALTFVAGFSLIVYGLKNIPDHKDCFPPTLTLAVTLPAGLLLLISNVLRIVSNVLQVPLETESAVAYTEVSAALTGVLPYLGILAGVCILLFGFMSKRGKTPSPLLFMAVSIYLVVYLIVCFQNWNMDPSIHDYAYKLLAAIFTMLGCFQLSGFAFGKGKRRITILWCLCSAYFSTISLPDFWMQSLAETLNGISFLLLNGGFALFLLYAPDPPEEAPAEGSLAENLPAESAE